MDKDFDKLHEFVEIMKVSFSHGSSQALKTVGEVPDPALPVLTTQMETQTSLQDRIAS